MKAINNHIFYFDYNFEPYANEPLLWFKQHLEDNRGNKPNI